MVGGWPRRLLLCYHAVDPEWPDPSLSVDPRRFESQLAHLKRAGYRGVTASSIVFEQHDDPVVAITFDDAYTSVFEYAFPILNECGWPGTVFVPTEPVAESGYLYFIPESVRLEHPISAAPLDWGRLGQLAERGWEIGSHSETHRLLSRLDDEELLEELDGSRRAIARQLGTCTSVSYPWGEVNDRVVSAARRVGYRFGSGLAGRFTWSDPLRTPRVLVAGVDGDKRMAVKASRVIWAVRRTPIWSMLDGARGLRGLRDEPVASPFRSVSSLGSRVSRPRKP